MWLQKSDQHSAVRYAQKSVTNPYKIMQSTLYMSNEMLKIQEKSPNEALMLLYLIQEL